MKIDTPQGGLAKRDDHTPEAQQKLKEIERKFDLAKKYRKPHDDVWDRMYSLYRNARKSIATARERDRDMGGVVLSMKREWGEWLPIPVAFSTIETAVPQALSNNPRMLPVPKLGAPDGAVDRVKRLFDQDQAAINYEIKLQSSFKRGEIYGLGVQKTYWRNEKKTVRANEKRTILPGYKGTERTVTKFDGPMAEDVDNYDFFWDPAAKDIDTCEWVIHRTWRSFDYMAEQVKSGRWAELNLEEVKKMTAPNGKGQVWSDRMQAAGLWNSSSDLGELHEIWEFNTCEGVCTVLDGQLLVQDDINPAYHNELPFQIFRPHLVAGELCGIGMIEMSETLINELGQLRGQRRDAATVALNPPIIYQKDMVDVDEIAFGSNVAWGTLTAPRDALYFPNLPDVPGSGYQEANEIKSDLDATTGIADPIRGGESDSGSASTATGMQLTVAAASRRIQQHTKNCEVEMLRPAARQWLWLYQQKVLENRPLVYEDEAQEGGWGHDEATPEDLEAMKDVLPEGGSTTADNEQQKQQKAIGLFNLLGQYEGVNKKAAVEYLLEQFDVPNLEAWIEQPPQVDPGVLQAFAQAAVKGGADQGAVLAVMQQILAATGQRPGPTENGNGSAPPEPVEQGAE